MARRLHQLKPELMGRLWGSYGKPLRGQRRITPPANYETIIASSVENYLIHSRQVRYYEDFSAIAIMGGGIGSSFASKVLHSLTQEFDIRIRVDAWTGNHQGYGKRSMVDQMWEAVASKSERWTTQLVVDLLKDVRKRLEGKRYLIVFAGVRNEDVDWFSDLSFNLPPGGTLEDKLSHALPKGTGGVVIVSTSTYDEADAIKMVGNRKKVLNLDCLLEDVSCLIFERALNEETTTQDELQIPEKLKNYLLENMH